MSLTLGAGWAVIEDNGDRMYMEDRFVAAQSIVPGVLLFGVFDGHNGPEVSSYCKTHIAEHIRTQLNDRSHLTFPKPIEHALAAAIEKLDTVASMDRKLPAAMDVGSTACIAMLTLDDVWFVNVGDSRAIIKTNHEVNQMTLDHKPNLKSETDRVKKHGGFISNTDGTWRINGRLNLSRSIGDWSMRPFIVPSPTIQHHRRPLREVDGADCVDCNEYIVIASDGLFDVMSNKDIVEIIDSQPHTRAGVTTALRELVTESRFRGSGDNITVVYVGLAITKKRTTRTYSRSR